MRKLNIVYIGNKLSVHGRTPTNIDVLSQLFENEGHIVYASSSQLNKLTRLKDMLSTIRKHRNTADVVLIDTYSTSAFYFALFCGWLCRLYGLRYVPILNGGNIPQRLSRSPWLCRQFFKNSFTNIAVSGYLQEYMQDLKYKCDVIENNIEIGKYIYRQRVDVSPKLLWVRAFHKTYNPEMAIYTVERLRNSYPDITLTMVGPDIDGSMAKCKELCRNLSLNDHISFTGKLSKSEWIELSEQHDIFINTTNYDNLPVSVIEAMALGLPVVSTNPGGIPYLIEDQKNGLLVRIGEDGMMANMIRAVLYAGEKLTDITENARNTAEQYDWEIIRAKWNNLFNTISTTD